MSRTNRRGFVKGASGTTFLAVGSGLIGPKTWAGANDRIGVACVGLNGRGASHLSGFGGLKDCEVVALCDPDGDVLARRALEVQRRSGKAPKTYRDLREAYADRDVNVVSIATPNHWHALAALWAVQAGHDVYVEKPGSHNIFEGRKVAEAAAKYGKIVQVGAQSRSNEGMREGIRKLHEGAIGDVYMAKGLCYKWRNTIGKVDGPQDPPPQVDYDLWLGPAPKKPVQRRQFHYDWHWFWDYGNGDIGNQGIHEMDKARWGLGVDWPAEIHATGGKFMFDDDQETPNTMLATFRYPDVNKVLVFEVRHWITNHEGGMGEGEDNTVGNIFYGTEGYMVMPSYSSYQIFLGRKREPQGLVERGGNHFQNFADAVRSRRAEDLNAPVDDVRISAGLCHLANIAYRLRRSLAFDAEKERFKGDAEANRLLRREYRKPFVVPEKV